MSNIDFNGRVAIVTGAGAGLGKDYAVNLAARGAKVVVNDLGGARDGSGDGSAQAADVVVDEIKAAGGEAVANYDNVASSEGGENIVKTAIDNYGKVDILINNAGILRDKSFVKMSEKEWDAVIAVHLKGTYNVTRPAFINMKANKYGRIVLTSSGSGMFGNFGQSNYAAAKAGMAGMVNVLKLEGAKYDIKTNLLMPSAGTRLTEDVMPPDMFAKLDVKYITPGVMYLVSEQCQESGIYLNAFAGFFSRSQVMSGPGHMFPEMPTVEQVAEKWADIMKLDNAKTYNDVNEIMFDALAAQVVEKQ
jgi:NAD(P)-dependent dehydrogenase (short-subunit alcohol dehydrogenase family)